MGPIIEESAIPKLVTAFGTSVEIEVGGPIEFVQAI